MTKSPNWAGFGSHCRASEILGVKTTLTLRGRGLVPLLTVTTHLSM